MELSVVLSLTRSNSYNPAIHYPSALLVFRHTFPLTVPFHALSTAIIRDLEEEVRLVWLDLLGTKLYPGEKVNRIATKYDQIYIRAMNGCQVHSSSLIGHVFAQDEIAHALIVVPEDDLGRWISIEETRSTPKRKRKYLSQTAIWDPYSLSGDVVVDENGMVTHGSNKKQKARKRRRIESVSPKKSEDAVSSEMRPASADPIHEVENPAVANERRKMMEKDDAHRHNPNTKSGGGEKEGEHSQDSEPKTAGADLNAVVAGVKSASQLGSVEITDNVDAENLSRQSVDSALDQQRSDETETKKDGHSQRNVDVSEDTTDLSAEKALAVDEEEHYMAHVETEVVDTEVAETEAVETEAIETVMVETEAVETEATETETAEKEMVETAEVEVEKSATEAMVTRDSSTLTEDTESTAIDPPLVLPKTDVLVPESQPLVEEAPAIMLPEAEQDQEVEMAGGLPDLSGDTAEKPVRTVCSSPNLVEAHAPNASELEHAAPDIDSSKETQPDIGPAVEQFSDGASDVAVDNVGDLEHAEDDETQSSIFLDGEDAFPTQSSIYLGADDDSQMGEGDAEATGESGGGLEGLHDDGGVKGASQDVGQQEISLSERLDGQRDESTDVEDFDGSTAVEVGSDDEGRLSDSELSRQETIADASQDDASRSLAVVDNLFTEDTGNVDWPEDNDDSSDGLPASQGDELEKSTPDIFSAIAPSIGKFPSPSRVYNRRWHRPRVVQLHADERWDDIVSSQVPDSQEVHTLGRNERSGSPTFTDPNLDDIDDSDIMNSQNKGALADASRETTPSPSRALSQPGTPSKISPSADHSIRRARSTSLSPPPISPSPYVRPPASVAALELRLLTFDNTTNLLRAQQAENDLLAKEIEEMEHERGAWDVERVKMMEERGEFMKRLLDVTAAVQRQRVETAALRTVVEFMKGAKPDATNQ
ncbi:hypothetical protein HK104_004797 [Borealophlyctis nickersoniae]|nr:hypothetical protein HK104_004797 [Borealophlyctis nickersoniae]